MGEHIWNIRDDDNRKQIFSDGLSAALGEFVGSLPAYRDDRWHGGLNAALKKGREVAPEVVPNWHDNSSIALNEFLELGDFECQINPYGKPVIVPELRGRAPKLYLETFGPEHHPQMNYENFRQIAVAFMDGWRGISTQTQ